MANAILQVDIRALKLKGRWLLIPFEIKVDHNNKWWFQTRKKKGLTLTNDNGQEIDTTDLNENLHNLLTKCWKSRQALLNKASSKGGNEEQWERTEGDFRWGSKVQRPLNSSNLIGQKL